MLSRARLASARALRLSSAAALCAAPAAPVAAPASQAAAVCAPWRSLGGALGESPQSSCAKGLSRFAETLGPTAVHGAASWRPVTVSQLILQRNFSAEQSHSQSQSQSQSPSEDAASSQEGSAEAEEAKESSASPDDAKDKEVAALKERLLLAYADMENLRERMRRENDNLKLFAVQVS